MNANLLQKSVITKYLIMWLCLLPESGRAIKTVILRVNFFNVVDMCLNGNYLLIHTKSRQSMSWNICVKEYIFVIDINLWTAVCPSFVCTSCCLQLDPCCCPASAFSQSCFSHLLAACLSRWSHVTHCGA